MRTVNQSVSTNGSGYWSNVAKEVKITGLDVAYVNEEGDFGELRIYFDTESWDVSTDGLIYTDRQFLKEFRDLLANMGLATEGVEYSEQGMQGEDYVSLDVGGKFIASFTK